MPSSQVEVQAPPGPPPGLVDVGGCHLPQFDQRSPGGNAKECLQDLKDELIREVTEGVREQIEIKTAAAMDSLWQRGQRALTYLHKQQTTQAEQLQSQLAACAESYRNLECEHAMLRSSLEALMKHLTLVFGPPPHMQPPSAQINHPQSPFFPQQAQNQTQTMASPPGIFPVSPTPPKTTTAMTPMESSGGGHNDFDNFHTPTDSPHVEGDKKATSVDEVSTVATPQVPQNTNSSVFASVGTTDTSTASGGAVSDSIGPASSEASPALPPTMADGSNASASVLAPPQSFTLTLRRADHVPLGLDVGVVNGAPCLFVEAVKPGGAVEAWNRQCSGEAREIRVGDHIIMINGVEDALAMQEECLTKYLLRMTVVRGTSDLPKGKPHTASGLRADADEFVPQVGPLPTYSPPNVKSC